MFTIACNGVESSFKDLHFSEPILRLITQGRSTLTVALPGAPGVSAPPPFPYEAAVIIRRNRTGATGGYTGGEIIFQGRALNVRRSANPLQPQCVLEFADAWYDFEVLPFQQYWTQQVAGQPPENTYFSRINLFQSLTRQYGLNPYLQSSGEQLREILDYAITQCGVNLQIGLIEPNMPREVYPIRAITCAEAIQMCLKLQPDAITHIDYATVPPTFHCRLRPSRIPVTMPYAGTLDGARHESSEITERPDLQLAQVILQYQKTNSDNGRSYTIFDTKTWPPNSTGLARRSLIVPLDLRGGSQTDLRVTVTAAFIDPGTLDWWKVKKPELNDPTITKLVLVGGAYTVKDAAGNDYLLTDYTNEFLKGVILPWMTDGGRHPVTCTPVTISAKITYQQNDANGTAVYKVEAKAPQQISWQGKLVNSSAGEVQYSTITSSDPGEYEPIGLEKQIFDAFAPLQYEGQHTVIYGPALADTMPLIGPQNALNLAGGAPAWLTMDAAIPQTEIDLWRGRITITIGPAKHLAPAEMQEALSTYRYRRVFDSPNLRVAALDAGASADLGGHTNQDNTTHGNPTFAYHVIQGDTIWPPA